MHMKAYQKTELGIFVDSFGMNWAVLWKRQEVLALKI